MINVTVVGFGNVGSSLSLMLLCHAQPIRLNLMEPSNEQEGALIDLAHSMALNSNKELHVNDNKLFQKADFIFFTAGKPNAHGDSRLSTVKHNRKLSQEVFEPRKFADNTCIIVISNPVDIISHAVHQFSGLPAKQVIGTGTFLDSIRLNYYLASQSDFQVSHFDSMVLGEHGASQVPIFSMSQLKGKPLQDEASFSAKDLDIAAQLTKDSAYRIRETQKGTVYGVAKCAASIMDYLLGTEEQFISLSMLTNEHYRSLLLLNHDIYIGLPVKIKNGQLELNNNIHFSDMELKALRASADLLASVD